MRARAILVALLLAVPVVALAPAVVSASPPRPLLLAQETGEGDEPVVGEEEEAGGQEGQDEGGAAEESGADEGETGAAEEETGPPWTYQMARLSFGLLLVLGLGIGLWYWRLIGRRQRAGV